MPEQVEIGLSLENIVERDVVKQWVAEAYLKKHMFSSFGNDVMDCTFVGKRLQMLLSNGEGTGLVSLGKRGLRG